MRKGDPPLTALQIFVRDLCVGREYDSCHDSPCPYASSGGCSHPKHPNNLADRWAAEEADEWKEPRP